MPLKSLKDEDLKLYYSISEVAQHLGVNSSLIRFWEKEFPQLKPKKNARGERFFTKKDIQLLDFIFKLVKVEGYTLEGARKILQLKKSRLKENPYAEQSLESVPKEEIREKLLDAYSKLLKMEATLKQSILKLKSQERNTLFD